MTPNRWLCAAVVMASTLSGSFAGAQCPSGCCKENAKLVQRSYPVADLIKGVGTEQTCEDKLIKTITRVIDPQCWQEHGGCGTISYCNSEHALVVHQTPEIHERLNAYLAALRHFTAKQERLATSDCCAAAPCCSAPCSAPKSECCTTAPCSAAKSGCCTAAPCCPAPCTTAKRGCCTAAPCCLQACAATAACACPQCQKGEACSCPNCKDCAACNCGKSKTCDSCGKHAVQAQPKQYGHFVMENVTINAMGVSARIKRIRVMYKGDGVDSDIAKCAMTNGESEKKVDTGKLDALIEKLSELLEKKMPTSMAAPCMPGSVIGAMVGAVAGSATCTAPCPMTSCSGSYAPCPSTASAPWTCAPAAAPTAAPVPPKPAPVECENEDD